MITEIEKLQRHANKIAKGKDPKVRPGQPERFTSAATVNDCIWQGDLAIVISEHVPAGYMQIHQLGDKDRQLVPGNTEGARHCLDSLDGVKIWRPQVWNEEVLEGPFMILSQELTITHPVHGAVTIPAGMTVQCHYQREWDRIQQMERRARD